MKLRTAHIVIEGKNNELNVTLRLKNPPEALNEWIDEIKDNKQLNYVLLLLKAYNIMKNSNFDGTVQEKKSVLNEILNSLIDVPSEDLSEAKNIMFKRKIEITVVTTPDFLPNNLKEIFNHHKVKITVKIDR